MNYKGLLICVLVSLGLKSCFDPSKPNYQYFPNMYEPIGYETYADSDAFANGIEAQTPVEGTIMRGWNHMNIQTQTMVMKQPKLN
jgi:hypothetical protein